mmetsp:Transcript_5574/g.15761  ORF Transcript_5574/g.15761 Transcript_5574/m.15761 type:complete len:81 (+) Transcript_5574:167-409(+)
MHAIATSLGRKDQRTKQQRKRDKRKDEKIAKLPSETGADDADPSLTMGKDVFQPTRTRMLRYPEADVTRKLTFREEGAHV